MSDHMMEIPPSDIAEFDQSFAASEKILWFLVDSFRAVRAQDEQQGLPEAVTIVGLARHIAEQWDFESASSALAAAVVLLDRVDANPVVSPRGDV